MTGFRKVISECRQGALARELDEALAEVVAEVKKTGNGGSITCTLKVQPEGVDEFGDINSVSIVDERPKIKRPAPGRTRKTVMFIQHDGHSLSTRDPRQPALPGVVPADSDDDDEDEDAESAARASGE